MYVCSMYVCMYVMVCMVCMVWYVCMDGWMGGCMYVFMYAINVM